MGCCGCSSRTTAIIAAILSLLQGSAWLGLSVYGLQLYTCNSKFYFDSTTINLDTGFGALLDSFSTLLYLSYFYNVDCAYERPTLDSALAPSVKWTDASQEQVSRTYSWLLTYIILSSLWILSSIILLIVACGNKKGRGSATWHYIWVLVMAAIIVADVVATVTYFLDIEKTLGLKSLLEFIGVTGLEAWQPGSSSVDFVTTIPVIFMGVIYAKFFILWIVNVTMAINVWIAARKIAKTAATKTVQKRGADNNSDPANTRVISGAPAGNMHRPQEPYGPNHFPSKPYTNPEQRYYQQQPMSSVNHAFVSDDSISQAVGPSRRFTPSYYNTDNHPQPQMIQREPIRNSQKANQYNTGLLRSDSNDSKMTTNELRRMKQEPWSYVTQDTLGNVRQSKMLETFEEDLPPIPVPDYTLHFPKRPRGKQPPAVFPKPAKKPIHPPILKSKGNENW